MGRGRSPTRDLVVPCENCCLSGRQLREEELSGDRDAQVAMNLKEYQERAIATSKFGEASNPRSAVAPMLGLAGATGAILDLYKKYFNDVVKLKDHAEYLREELGDLLWYVAVVARTFGLDLEDIAR